LSKETRVDLVNWSLVYPP